MGNRNRSFVLAGALGILLAAAGQANAGNLTVYNDLASFQAATIRLTDVNSNGIVAPGSFTCYVIPSGYNDAATGTNFTYLNASGDFINITSGSYPCYSFPSGSTDRN